MMLRIFVWLLFVPVIASGARADDAPIVVELFTSQGCSSCPAADKYMGELVKRPELLVLAFHVEYWNYIGWTDPYSKPWATRRQREYSARLKQRFIYTPEIVVQGGAEGIGSERETIEALIRAAAEKRASAPPVKLRWRDDGALIADIGDGRSPGGQPAAVWLVGFDRMHTTQIMSGENEGKTSWDHHPVRYFKRLGSWGGSAEQLVVPSEETKTLGDYGAAILVQQDGTGPIITAAATNLPKP